MLKKWMGGLCAAITGMEMAVQTNELMFELSHQHRLQILDILEREPRRMSHIARDIGSTTVEISRHLDRLAKMHLVEKRSDNHYYLTEMARMVKVELTGMKFLSENSDFFSTHDLSGIPNTLVRLPSMATGRINYGTLENVSVVKEMTEEAEESVWIMADQPMRSVVRENVEKMMDGIKFRILYPVGAKVPLEYKKPKGKVLEIRFVDKVPIAIKLNEKRGGLVLKDLAGNLDYNEAITGSDEAFLSWLKSLFEYYWQLGE